MAKPDLFAYLDYRRFLKDAFAFLQVREPRFSYRSFAKAAGYTSPNFLQSVISGKRNLSPANLLGTVRALDLNKQESEFFLSLVGFTQARDFEEKNFHYQRMLRSRRYAVSKPIETGRFEYFHQWYHAAVRELAIHRDFTGDPAWIADRLHPRPTVPQVERSLELLQRLGLIRKEEASGRWSQSETVISTPAEVASLAAANYHRAMLKLASDAIEAFPQDQRDLRSVTLGIPSSAYPALKRKMEDFWMEILALCESQAGVEEVLQINLQLFPLTKKKEGDHVPLNH